MTEIRPIDANALKEKMWRSAVDTREKIAELIDNAPTVPLPEFKEGYKQAIKDGKTNFARPQGKWINANGEYMCTNCKSHSESIRPFCSFCGADMRGKDND